MSLTRHGVTRPRRKTQTVRLKAMEMRSALPW